MDLWAADSHVHFHKCFDKGLFFDHAFENLSKTALPAVKNGILFFTEGKNENYFNQLRDLTSIKSLRKKQTEYLIDSKSGDNFFAVKNTNDGTRLIIVTGYQIVTKENLEVLSLGTRKRLNDGNSIEDTISEVQSLGGIPVIPWGFGKWYGSRGNKVNELIGKKLYPFFLGDNGGRTDLLPFPSQFIDAKSKGIKILPGSDPLPFINEVSKVLSYGFTFEANINDTNLWDEVKSVLLNPEFSFNIFGKITSPLNFIRTQIAMQIKKRNS